MEFFSILFLGKNADERKNFLTIFAYKMIVKYYLWLYRNINLHKKKKPYCLNYLFE